MWSLRHVVRDVRPEHSLEVPTTVDQDVVEALLAHGPHKPLGECVRPRCADRRSNDADAEVDLGLLAREMVGHDGHLDESAAAGMPRSLSISPATTTLVPEISFGMTRLSL